MTHTEQITAFLTPETRKRFNVSQIERDSGLGRNTLSNVIHGARYRHLTPEQVDKLIPVLNELGFKLLK